MSEWQRLDSKMLFLGPISAVRQFLFPALVALIGIGTRQPQWLLYAAPLIVLGSIGLGVLPWLTTRFRVAEGQLVVTRGLINRTRLTAPLDRIRSVDLEASILHRMLDLQKVQVGTGVDDTMIELNALTNDQAMQLRGVLLARRAGVPGAAPHDDIAPSRSSASEPHPDAPLPQLPEPTELARFSTSWAKYAPFSIGRLAIALGAFGALFQFAGDFNIDLERGGAVWERIVEGSVVLIVAGITVGALVMWTLAAMVAFLIQWWDMRLVRDEENLSLTRGLFTTASTTLEEQRIRGIEVRETALLRKVGAGELHALVTGLDDAVYALLPPTPVDVFTAVAESVLGESTPLTVSLAEHGRQARRRCYVRNLRRLLPVVVIAIAATWLLDGPVWAPLIVTALMIPVGLLLGRSEYAHLGHALTPLHLVAGSGITARTRTVLQRSGIIGWVVSQTWFQRRRGLATLTATTAAGSEQVAIRDIPLVEAVAFASETTPDVVVPFLLGQEGVVGERRPVSPTLGT